MPTAISASADTGSREQQRANEHPEGRAELGFVPGKDRVWPEQTERQDDEQGRGDDSLSAGSLQRSPIIGARLMVEETK